LRFDGFKERSSAGAVEFTKKRDMKDARVAMKFDIITLLHHTITTSINCSVETIPQTVLHL
jgi:hypothetical protein